eukprot:6425452-Ditylum_brightwellii.AAC.1
MGGIQGGMAMSGVSVSLGSAAGSHIGPVGAADCGAVVSVTLDGATGSHIGPMFGGICTLRCGAGGTSFFVHCQHCEAVLLEMDAVASIMIDGWAKIPAINTPNTPCICMYADNFGLRRDARKRLSVIVACGRSLYHSMMGNVGAMQHSPAMKWHLNVWIAFSAALRLWQ